MTQSVTKSGTGGRNLRSGTPLFLAIVLMATTTLSIARAQQTFIDPQLQPHILRGMDLITNADYEEAAHEAQRIQELAPHDPSGDFLAAMICWHRMVIQGEADERLEHSLFDHLDRTIEKAKRIEDADKDDVLALFWLGAGYGYKARYHSSRSEWWSAYRNGKRTKSYFERVTAVAPEDHDPYLGLGIYHYYAEVVPKIIRVFDFVLNMGGDKELGLRELELALDKGFFTKNEAKYFLVDIFLNYEQRPWDALALLLDLTQSFPGNRGFRRQLAEVYGQLGLHDIAARTWQELQRDYRGNVDQATLAGVHLGEQLLRAGEIGEAKRVLSAIVTKDSRQAPRALARAHYGLAVASDLTGDQPGARSHYRKVVELGDGDLAAAAKARLADPTDLPLDILQHHSSTIANGGLPAHRTGALEARLRKVLPGGNAVTQQACAHVLGSIARFRLLHGEPEVAKEIATEILSLRGSQSDSLAVALYELRGVANYRMGLFAQAAEDHNLAAGKTTDAESEKLRKDIDFIRSRGPATAEPSAWEEPAARSTEPTIVSCKFTYPDLGQLAVSIVGDFNDWDLHDGQMALSDGEWTKELALAPGKYKYQFLINGWQHRIDHNALSVERGGGTRYDSVREVAR